MIWFIGVIGFVSGFGFGIYLIKQILASKNREELINDKSLRWKYGSLVWGFAIANCISFIYVYNNFYNNIGE